MRWKRLSAVMASACVGILEGRGKLGHDAESPVQYDRNPL